MEDPKIQVDEDKVERRSDDVDLHSDHGVDEPLNPGSKRSSMTSLSRKKKKKEPLCVDLSLPYYSLRIGTIQFFVGVFLILFGIGAVASNAGMTKYTFGIWVGVAGTSAGVLGVLLAQMRRRDLLLASLIVSISAVILAGVTITAACIGVKEDVDARRDQNERKVYLIDALINYNPMIAMNSILIVLCIFEAIVATVNVLFCSLYVKMVMEQPTPPPPQQQVQEDFVVQKDFADANNPNTTNMPTAPNMPSTQTTIPTKHLKDVTHRNCGCAVYLGYNGAVGLRCGILQLTFGILLLAFGIVNLALNGWGSEFAIAVWGSVFVIAAGSLGIHSATDKRRDILICCCFFSTISCAAVTGLFITAAVAAKYDFPQLPLGKVVVQIILMVFSLAEFITGVFQATCCGQAFPEHDANQHHYGSTPQADRSVTRAATSDVAPVPQQHNSVANNSPMVILPLPGRAKDPFSINYGPGKQGGFFISVNDRVPYMDDDDDGMGTSVHYAGKEAAKGGAANV